MAVNLYTREEVAKHNGKKNTQLWIVIRDIVYDVSTHLTEVIERYISRSHVDPKKMVIRPQILHDKIYSA